MARDIPDAAFKKFLDGHELSRDEMDKIADAVNLLIVGTPANVYLFEEDGTWICVSIPSPRQVAVYRPIGTPALEKSLSKKASDWIANHVSCAGCTSSAARPVDTEPGDTRPRKTKEDALERTLFIALCLVIGQNPVTVRKFLEDNGRLHWIRPHIYAACRADSLDDINAWYPIPPFTG